MLTGEENTERDATPVSNLTFWVKDVSVIVTLAAEKKATLHCDVPFDVLS